jgi:hemerythrin-like domain-containing protein
MHKITTYLDQDHRRCDDRYGLAETAVAQRDWDAADGHFTGFLNLFARHLDKEERVLFPRLDRAMGNAYGPTAVMRAEHAHMRGILAHMRGAIARHDSDGFFDHADALRVLMRQHSRKEEAVLYPQADRVLHAEAEDIVDCMAQLDESHAAAGSPA